MDDLDRRRLLGALAAAGVTAGCSGLGDDGGDGTETAAGDGTTTATGRSTGAASPGSTAATTGDPATEGPTTDPADGPTTTASDPDLLPADPAPPADMAAVEAALSTTNGVAADRLDAGPYEPTWDSLAGYETPEWLRDRKFGIYFHWGLYSVPAYKYEWYPKWMYTPDREGWGSDVHDHHVATYGAPDEYPYQAFADGYTAEAFDAAAWAELFADAGAGFAGPVVEHHDGWSNWQSAINPYNADAMGPERDLVGELETAIRDEGMKFVTTFHHGRAVRPDRKLPDDENYLDAYYGGAYEHYPSVTEGFPNRLLYKNVDDAERWDMWLGKLVEVCERYGPDMVWHDSLHVPDEARRREYIAYNLNRAAAQDRDVAITYKEVEIRDVVESNTLTLDYENEMAEDIQADPWLADINVANGAWCYTEQLEFRPVGELVAILAAIVSKNGQMLLNVPPMPDGTLPEPARERLRGIGDWLDVNGEAIVETRPWDTWNDGEIVRYTRSKDGTTLYAIVYGYPGGDLELSEAPSPSTGATVTMLGHGEISHRTDGGSVVLEVPELGEDERPSDHAVSFRLDGFIS